VAISKVPVGGGVILDDPAPYVVTQPAKGKFKAFSKICTHRQCTVADVRDGVIHCDCHQSDFSIKDGSVVHDPAPEPLAEAKVKVFDGKIYVVS
jgi:Rieske Fe-S protein